jgi:hypothetical protein
MDINKEASQIIVALTEASKKLLPNIELPTVDITGDFPCISWGVGGIDVGVPITVKTLDGNRTAEGFSAWIGISTPATRDTPPDYDIDSIMETLSGMVAVESLIKITFQQEMESLIWNIYAAQEEE